LHKGSRLYRHLELQQVLVDDFFLHSGQLVDVPGHRQISAVEPIPTLLSQPGEPALNISISFCEIIAALLTYSAEIHSIGKRRIPDVAFLQGVMLRLRRYDSSWVHLRDVRTPLLASTVPQ